MTLYFDRKKEAVKLLSNSHDDSTISDFAIEKLGDRKYRRVKIDKPKIVSDYNTYTHGVDIRN